MANDWYDNEDDDFEDEQQNANGPKALRDALKAEKAKAREAAKELAELREQFDTLNKGLRASKLSDLLSAKGVNPKAANLLPSDLEATDEAVTQWLDQYADVLNIQRNEGQDADTEQQVAALDEESDVDPDSFESTYGRVQNVTGGSSATPSVKASRVDQALDNALNDPNLSAHDVEALLKQQGFVVGRQVG